MTIEIDKDIRALMRIDLRNNKRIEKLPHGWGEKVPNLSRYSSLIRRVFKDVNNETAILVTHLSA